MNLNELHQGEKEVSTALIFKGSEGKATSLFIKKNGILKAHVTKVPALLLCVKGRAVYEDEKGRKVELNPGDYFEIEAMVLHWVTGVEDSDLVVVK
jgi:quercetin dioxygenase-like cupin family protein